MQQEQGSATPAQFAQALACHRAGRLDEAEALYLEGLAAVPGHAPSLCHLGLLSLMRGDGAAAVRRFGAAMALDLQYYEARIGLASALRLTGRTDQAEPVLREVARLWPDRPQVLNELGLVQRLNGHAEAAVASFEAAIALDPGFAEAHNHLGNALCDLGRTEDGLAAYRRALALKPDLADAHSNLGGVLSTLGRHEEALGCCRKALELRPAFPEALNNLGNALVGLKQPAPAVEAFAGALVLRPAFPEALNNLAIALQNLGRLDEAEARCRAALALRPAYPEAHNNLCHILKDLGRLDEAESEGRAALALRPAYPEALSNLGNVLYELGRLDEAVANYHQALALRPDYPEALSNLGHTWKAMGRTDAAVAACRQAIALRPDYAQAHANLAFSLLLAGTMTEGWQEYEWRWRLGDNPSGQRVFTQPVWQGEPLAGRTLLLHVEQGLGDMLQFCRYAPLAAARGGRVVLETYAPLVRLLSTLPGVAQVVTAGAALPPFDCRLPLMSLPHVLGTTLETVPAAVPYLRADPVRTAAWRERLASEGKPTVGLVWAGDPHPDDIRARLIDRRRSVTLAALRPVLEVPGLRFVSLQMGAGASQIDALPSALRPRTVMDGVGDFLDSAAIVAALDLVITVDTAMAHLAGALGVPTWVLSRYDGCWRWLLNRDDSPWYPTLRLFRQPRPNDWDTPIAAVAAALAARGEQAAGAAPRVV